MENFITQFLPNLGLAGFAIFIMWKQSESSARRFREKDEDMTKLNEEVRHMMMTQISENTQALRDNTEALSVLKAIIGNK